MISHALGFPVAGLLFTLAATASNPLLVLLYVALAFPVFVGDLGLIIFRFAEGEDDFHIISEALKKIKSNNKNVEKLKKRKGKEKFRSTNLMMYDETLEDPIRYNIDSLSTIIMNNYNDLLVRVDFIKDRQSKYKMLSEIKASMDGFMDKYKAVLNKGKQKIKLTNDDYSKLINETIVELSELESKLKDIGNKDAKISRIERDYDKLNAMIEESIKENEEVGEVAVSRNK